MFSVNAAVVRCNKKPGPPVRLAGFLSASGSELIAAASEVTPARGPQPRLPTEFNPVITSGVPAGASTRLELGRVAFDFVPKSLPIAFSRWHSIESLPRFCPRRGARFLDFLFLRCPLLTAHRWHNFVETKLDCCISLPRCLQMAQNGNQKSQLGTSAQRHETDLMSRLSQSGWRPILERARKGRVFLLTAITAICGGTVTKQADINRVWEVVERVGVCMMTTQFLEGLRARPLEARADRDESVIWFLADRRAAKDDEIEAFPEICLTFVYPKEKVYLSISGQASVGRDTERARSLWNEQQQVWWPGGPSDPNVLVIQFSPKRAEIWDGPASSAVAACEFAKARATGRKPNLGEKRKSMVKLN